MDIQEFEKIAQEELESLPAHFLERMENVHVVVEYLPSEDLLRRVGGASRHTLLGLYQGIPMTHRDTGYGAYPVVPDTITLFQHNIESVVTKGRVREKIREVLIHEIAHYFGMNEQEIRLAGF